MTRSRSGTERLRRFYKHFSSDDHVLVLINADPDAVGSAMAVKRLLWRKVAGVGIGHVNVVERPDNLAMIRLLGVKMQLLRAIPDGPYKQFVLVDSQPNHHELFQAVPLTAIIDHHPDTGAKAPYTDIRPDYGATASIMTEYLRSARIKPSVKLATALFHAIKTDTSNFERQTRMEDLRAFQFLFHHANVNLARRIEQADLNLDFLRYFKIALDALLLRRRKAFVHLGAVGNPDICVLIADFLMRLTCVDWSIVSCIAGDMLVVVFRNDGVRKDAGRLARQSFGQWGSAGGHSSMSRAEIPVGALERITAGKDNHTIPGWIVDQVEKKTRKPKKEPPP
jgi:nanoRNase/pAp phosphatase (c-di-AMP/oligoRNAs hydrolase)